MANLRYHCIVGTSASLPEIPNPQQQKNSREPEEELGRRPEGTVAGPGRHQIGVRGEPGGRARTPSDLMAEKARRLGPEAVILECRESPMAGPGRHQI